MGLRKLVGVNDARDVAALSLVLAVFYRAGRIIAGVEEAT